MIPLILPLDDPRAVLAVAGGKGESLARLVRAGLPVPAGFHLTTRAYRERSMDGCAGGVPRARRTGGGAVVGHRGGPGGAVVRGPARHRADRVRGRRCSPAPRPS
ncbi:hypothetical protein SK571_31430 [Lentzea sp. BCCO 10_0798]|uniref:Pyruvate phosphate dikinase, PEP/pyruvate binding domain n=1 Tax=Lentzea kristufekii TaxID=3095430 RepID=A0ABU4U005_9PSEU|nr:hypothetical protein [Lentzea sp. BCCO 10_0798]MDX8053905.1 hypothetical protein [Lentzea sp. BCCO 10_0798]